jgi:hypothetical protein
MDGTTMLAAKAKGERTRKSPRIAALVKNAGELFMIPVSSYGWKESITMRCF